MYYVLMSDHSVKQVSSDQWSVSFDRKDRRVAETTIGEDYWVSTVFLGIDHSFGGGPPLLFETMVFPKGQHNDLDCRRYSTWAEAEAGHADVVKEWTTQVAAACVSSKGGTEQEGE